MVKMVVVSMRLSIKNLGLNWRRGFREKEGTGGE